MLLISQFGYVALFLQYDNEYIQFILALLTHAREPYDTTINFAISHRFVVFQIFQCMVEFSTCNNNLDQSSIAWRVRPINSCKFNFIIVTFRIIRIGGVGWSGRLAAIGSEAGSGSKDLFSSTRRHNFFNVNSPV